MKIRYVIMAVFLLAFSWFSINHFISGSATVDALCPFGGFETLYTYLTAGKLVPRVMQSSLVLAAGILLTVFIFRRGFCGYLCPFGTLQELIGRLKKKLNLDQQARNLKYAVLAIILVGTVITGTLVFRNYDPFLTFFHFGKGVLWDYEPGHLQVFIITLAVLAASVFIVRFWCRYFCPLGAITALLSRFSFTKLQRDHKCIDCKLCDKACPVDIKVSKEKAIKTPECLNCNRCVDVCPKDALPLTLFGKRVSTNTYGLSIVAFLVAFVVIAQASGHWESVPLLDEILTSELQPEDIKGWMTFEHISNATGIPAEQIIADVGLPPNVPPYTPFNQVGSLIGSEFHTKIVRSYVQNLGAPEDKKIQCPWGIEDDPRPGLCGLYVDNDQDNVCDYSE